MRAAAAVALAVSFLVAPCAAQQKEIETEVARERGVIATLGLGADEAKAMGDRLTCAEVAARAGRPLLALYYVYGVYGDLGGNQYMKANAKSAVDFAAFERHWRAEGRTVKAKERKLDRAPARRRPQVVLALAEAARGQTGPYYAAARDYGRDAGPDAGLYYTGLALANLDFAAFCRTVPVADAGAPAPLSSLAPELQKLESAVVSAYSHADADGRRRFLEINASLKLAGELDARGWYEGALEKYLEVAMRFRLATAPKADASRAAELGASLDAFRAKLASAGGDQTIGQLFVEMAATALERGCVADPDPLSRAAAIVDDVLPRYFEYQARIRR